MLKIAAHDERVVLLTADLGFGVFESFADRFPRRFINVGVAEQNMLGLATGLAASGFVPYVYSIGTFAMRAYEFIRNGAVLHHLPIRIVGVGAGFDYGSAGFTHHVLEDLALMRIQPGLTVIAPADSAQTCNAFLSTATEVGPVYYRLAKDGPSIRSLEGRFRLGRLELIREGAGLAFVATGAVTAEVIVACDLLAAQGIQAAIAVVASLNPAPTADLVDLAERYARLISVETHYRTGGLGSLLAESIADHGTNCRLLRCGATDLAIDGVSGSADFLIHRHGLNSEALAASALQFCRD